MEIREVCDLLAFAIDDECSSARSSLQERSLEEHVAPLLVATAILGVPWLVNNS